MEIVASNKTSRPLYEQLPTQVKARIMSGALKAGEPLPSWAVLTEKAGGRFSLSVLLNVSNDRGGVRNERNNFNRG